MSPNPRSVPQNEVDVRNELQAILWSAEFAGSERLSRFLRFIVEQYLEGNNERLKEVVIGIEVFDRNPDYDPKIEPIVRTEARRLRTKLEAYYATAGREHAIRITVPKGGYLPKVDIQSAPVVEIAAPQTVVIVDEPHKPFEPVGPNTLRGNRARAIYPSVAALLVVAAAAGIWVMNRTEEPSYPAPKQLNVTSLRGREVGPSFSPDASQIVFSWESEEPGRSGLYITMTRGGPLHRLTSDARDRHAAWSPDGNWIAFNRGDNIMLVRPLGGEERTLAAGETVSQIAWAQDSKSVAFAAFVNSSHFGIVVAAVPGGELRQMTNPPADFNGDFAAAFSPDGRELAFTRCRSSSCDIEVMDIRGGQPRRIAQTQVRLQGLTWTADGRDIVFASGRRGFMRLYRVNAASPGQPAPVIAAAEDAWMPAIRKNRLAYVHEEININLWEKSQDGGGSKRLIGSTEVESSPQFSPDGKRIAFVSDRSGFDEIWTAGRDGQNPVQITFFADGSAGSPRWSPDAQRLVFDHLNAYGRELYVVDAGGGTPQRLTETAEVARPSWSQDGTWVYYGLTVRAESQIWKVDWRNPQRKARVTEGGGFEAWESHDGRQLFYSRGSELWTKPVGGGAEERLLPKIRHGWWSVADAGIYFVDIGYAPAPSEPKPVNYYDFQTRRVTRVATIEGNVYPARPDFCVSRDGRTMLYGLQELSNADIRMVDNFR